jgi:hypothetical protein
MTDPTRSYCQAALLGLRFVESRQPSQRRFGDNARALWAEFRGDLTDGDRIDLMLRDADVQLPGALGAKTVFNPEGVAEDDALGAGWDGLDAVDAAELLGDVERPPAPRTRREQYRRRLPLGVSACTAARSMARTIAVRAGAEDVAGNGE